MNHRLFWALLGAALLFFWPWRAQAQVDETDPFDTLEVALLTRQCLKNNAGVHVAPGAAATIFEYEGFTFVYWPAAIALSSTRNYTALPLLHPETGKTVVMIEFSGTAADVEANRPALNSVANCSGVAISLLALRDAARRL